MRDLVIAELADRGVTLPEIGALVYRIQKGFQPELTPAACEACVHEVLGKREVQHALLTGIALDRLAEAGRLPQPLQGIVASDDSLYGIDEVLALGVTNIYGSIGLTNFGYLDKAKPAVLERLTRESHRPAAGICHTFLDDLVAAVAAAAAAKLAHARRP